MLLCMFSLLGTTKHWLFIEEEMLLQQDIQASPQQPQ